jgi:hypothetical protein
MKPRIRNVSNLYFRWGEKYGLDTEDVATALEQAGLIERIGRNKYQEVKRLKVQPDEYERTIGTVLSLYKELKYEPK